MKHFDSLTPFPLLKDCTIRGLRDVINFIPPLPQIHKKWGAEERALYHVCLVGSSSLCIIKTLNVRGPSYLGLTRSISWLLVPWLLTSPGHHHPWYWLCRIGRFLSDLRKDFNYLDHCGDMTQNVNIRLCSLKNLARKVEEKKSGNDTSRDM